MKRLLSAIIALCLVLSALPSMLLQSSAGGGGGSIDFLDERGMPVEIYANNQTIYERTYGWAVSAG